MTKEVLITIKGLQTLSQEEEPTELVMVVTGNYYHRNGHHFILYDEVMEEFQEVTHNIVKVKDDTVEVKKKGIANVHMIFEEQKKNVTFYHTPFGNMQMGLSATKISVNETAENLDIVVDYAMEINEEHVADCCLNMNVKAKGAGDFSLSS
jgi:uncharacterized beta-barrel protein YwiB (DUF1934 family)